ncbi:hypothetical protein MYP_1765 [Sporocytophaga myxococcoides]|uniref:DUF4286 domain-containing protein n=1 Tax=Sporocytophaga myxococcoides TaxID=153721 RepID=A0A098LDL3_9BACT|nr:DUF4286 family protein [Sporocytophaga myxococcoides]GAL84537.1 hypothetical protein MYP_1765 [Sporocytophaga myxococcoides]
MIIYNLTLVSLPEIQTKVLSEIKSNYIPALQKNKHGLNHKVMKVLSGEGNESTFALQVSFESQDNYISFIDTYEYILIEEIQKKFPNQVMPFATLLEEL